MGHYASVCKTKPSNDSATGNKLSGRKKEFGETKYLEEVVEEDMEDDEVLGFFAVKKSGKDGHTLIYVSVMLALSPTWGQGTKRDAGSEEL